MLNDLYKIDTIHCIVVSSTFLSDRAARRGHTMVDIGTDIYIFGGSSGSGSGSYSNDFYKIDTTTNTATEITITGTTISARGYHSMVAIETDIYIFGGYGGTDIGLLNDFYNIDTINCNVVYSNVLSDITERNGHKIVNIGTGINIYGGSGRGSNIELLVVGVVVVGLILLYFLTPSPLPVLLLLLLLLVFSNTGDSDLTAAAPPPPPPLLLLLLLLLLRVGVFLILILEEDLDVVGGGSIKCDLPPPLLLLLLLLI